MCFVAMTKNNNKPKLRIPYIPEGGYDVVPPEGSQVGIIRDVSGPRLTKTNKRLIADGVDPGPFSYRIIVTIESCVNSGWGYLYLKCTKKGRLERGRFGTWALNKLCHAARVPPCQAGDIEKYLINVPIVIFVSLVDRCVFVEASGQVNDEQLIQAVEYLKLFPEAAYESY